MKKKNLIEMLITNKIFRNISVGTSCILLALLYNKIFIQPYSNTEKNAFITFFWGDSAFMGYSIPSPLLIVFIAMFIYLLYMLVAHMYKMSHVEFNDKKHTKRAIAVSAITIYIVIAGALIHCADDMQKSSFWKSDLIETSYHTIHDLVGEAPSYEITGGFPTVTYEIEESVYGKGIVLFDEITSTDINVAIYYASSTGAFSEEHKVICLKNAGTDYAAFRLPKDYQIQYIMVHYWGTNGIVIGDEWHIDSVYVEKDTVRTKLHGRLTARTGLNLLWLTAIFMVIFWSIWQGETLWEKYYKNAKFRIAAEILMIAALPAVLFWQYISGQTCFVFTDIGNDSFAQYYPGLLHLADRIENGQWTEMFSFIIGLGDKESSIIPNLLNLPAVFGRENVAYLMGISIFLKVVLSGLFTYGLAGLWGVDDERRLVVTFGYEFNAMLTVRSCWESYSNLALMIIFWLYCFELAYRKEKHKFYLLFAFASELFCLQFSLAYCLLYGFIFLVYIFCRILSDGKGIKSACKYGILNYGVFAFWGIADSFRTSLASVVSSGRISKTSVDHFTISIKFQWEVLYEAFIRSIGQAISGISGDFVGLINLLEGPAFYFGIFTLIIIPVAYYNLPKKKKVLFILGLLASFMYITVKSVRILAGGFTGTTFKFGSFWISILGILMILEAFSNIKGNGFRKNSLLVFNITAAICFALIISIVFSSKVARRSQWWLSLIYFLIYCVLVNLVYVYNVKVLKWVFLLAIMTEGIVLSYDVMNDRATYTITELNDLIYDDTYKAIHEIAAEDSSWYRIEKDTDTATYCDSYTQNYYGTKSYVGGTLIGSGIRNYYRELSLPSMLEMRILCGTAGNLYANSLLGVKYIFVDGMDNFRYGTQYIASYGDVEIYENTLALPIGYFYDATIEADEFEKMSYWDRNKVLLERVLCTREDYEFDTDAVKEKANFDGEAIQYKFTSTQKSIDVSEIEGLLVVDICFKSEGEKPRYGNFFWIDSEGNSNHQFISTGVLEICADDISSIHFDEAMTDNIDYVNVYVYDPDKYYAETVSAIQKLQANGMEVTNISDYEINGTIEATSDGVFATSIPYDSNWEIYIDGVKTELLQVNTGFIGTKMTAGKHNVRIYYQHRSWLECNKYKCIGGGILLLYSIYIIVVDMKKKVRN